MALALPQVAQGMTRAERLDLVVSITSPVVHTAKPERSPNCAPDRSPPAGRSDASGWGDIAGLWQ
jgi:hypothetical protein